MPSTITDRLNGLTTSVAVKAACRVATTANITLSGLQTIDGVAVAALDRVLVKDQTDAAENGIWVAAAGAWSRASDFNGSLDAVGGTLVIVTSGVTNANSFWQIDGYGDLVIGTDDITFEATSGNISLQADLASTASGKGADLVGFSQSATYTVGTYGKRAQNEVRFIDFDPICYGGGTANATAFSNAVSALIARGGGSLILGKCQVDASTLGTIVAGVMVNLIGEGERTILNCTSTTADFLTHQAWYSTIEGIRFTSSVTRTAGAFLTVSGSDHLIQHCNFSNDFIGIKSSSVNCQIARNEFSSGVTNARRIWITGGDTAQHIYKNCMKAQSPVIASSGIFTDNSVSLKIEGNQIISQGRCLHIAPGNGQTVQSLHSFDNDYDTATYGIACEPSGTGTVYRCQSLKDHISNHSASGGLFSASTGAGLIDGFELNLMRAANNGTDGVSVAGDKANNIRINGGFSRAHANGSGVGLGAGTSKVYANGVQMQAADGYTANKYGFFVGAGADNYRFENCDVTGQVTTNIHNHTSASTRIVKDNIGYVTEAEGATSVADGGTISHGLATTPTVVTCTASTTGEFVSVTAKSSSTFTTAIKKHDNTAGTTQTVYWRASI